MPQYVINCRLYTEPAEVRHLALEDGKILGICREIPEHADILFDARERIVAPGLIDTHVHGAGGGDLSDGTEAGVHTAASTLCRLGTTTFYATSFYLPGAENKHLQLLGSIGAGEGEAACPGIHLEGPFINPVKKGGIPAEYLSKPGMAVYRDIRRKCGGRLSILTCAPELDGMEEILSACREDGVVASFGHSDADTEQARKGFEQGMGYVTHLGNAMRPFHHRDPGPLPAILAFGVPVQLISDGVHLYAGAIRFYRDIFGPERCICITDGIECTGLPDGEYHFRSKPYISEKGAVFYADGSGLIGTSLSLFEIMMRFKRFTGCPLREALQAASENPARRMGIDGRKGFIRPGYDADLIVIGENDELCAVIRSGNLIE